MRKTKLNITMLMALALIIAFSTAALAKGNVKIIDGNKAVKGKDAPRFVIETLDGEDFKLHEFRGKKPIIIVFWGLECPPCMKELPYIQKFYEKYSDSVEIIGVSSDPKRNRTQIKNRVKELGLTFKIGHDYENKLRTKIYLSRFVPFLVVIDKEGKVILLQAGSAHPEKLIAELEELLGDDITVNVEEPELIEESEANDKDKEA